MMDRRTFLVSSSILAALAAAGQFAGVACADQEPLKVGFIYVGPVGDAGWTYAHDQGRKALEKEFGSKVKTTYVENVAEGADTERVLRQLVADGNKVIFTTSFGFMNATVKVAQSTPNVIFAGQHQRGQSGLTHGVPASASSDVTWHQCPSATVRAGAGAGVDPSGRAFRSVNHVMTL